ncbi:MAG: DUF4403 family protein [Xanthobacteraceae bacterium]
MALPIGKIAAGAMVVAVSFGGAFWVMHVMSPGAERRPALAEVPPLKPLSRASMIVTPMAVSLAAIREVIEQAAPKNITGERSDLISQFLKDGKIGWDINRGALTITGQADSIAVSAPLNGTLRATGQFSGQGGDISGLISSFLSQNSRRGPDARGNQPVDQRGNLRGNVTMTARPAILPAWRIDPNLSARVSLTDASTTIMGFRLNLAQDVKPMVDEAVNEQIGELQAKVRSDPFLETIARREWSKMCRSVALGAMAEGMPNLWLEIRPIRAFAAQPRTDRAAVTLTLGVQAETRVVAGETKPDCPFPAQIDIVPQLEQGRANLAVPIDVPFTELNRLLEAQLKDKTFPEGQSGAFAVDVRGVSVAASGDRLLISLRVRANEKKSWFGLGAEATVYVWGRPVLDNARQILRLTDIALDVQSEAAFGILGAAARATAPYLEKAVADNATIDLKPFVQSARQSLEAAIAEMRQTAGGVRVDAAVTALRLVGIAFDARTLRVIAEADGTVRVAVTALPLQ